MKKSKLLQALRSCTPSELSELERLLLSPYFNRDEQVVGLFNYLKAYYPGFSHAGLQKEAAFRQIFPGAQYNDKQLRYLMSDLNKLVERFFGVRRYEQQAYRPELDLLESLSERGLLKAYQQIGRQLKKDLEAPRENSSQYFLARFQWSGIREEHFQRQRLRQYDASIQHAADHLDRFYYLHRLKLACAMLDRQAIFQADYELNLSPDWIRHLEELDFFGEPIIRLYYTIFQALRKEKEERYFEMLKSFLVKLSPSIPPTDLKDIYLFAINYCARKIRQGKEQYISEALQLYRTGIESHFLIEDRELSPWAFTNVVKLSLRLKYYNWIETFIQQYAPMLPEAFRDNALHYNLAELYYYTQRFDLAREHLVQVAYSDLNYYLGARVLLAKIYYETGEEEPLLSLIAAFTIFLKRNKKISDDLKKTYLNFCELLFQIIRQKSGEWEQLQGKIRSTRLLTDRNWLAAIYEEVKKDTTHPRS